MLCVSAWQWPACEACISMNIARVGWILWPICWKRKFVFEWIWNVCDDLCELTAFSEIAVNISSIVASSTIPIIDTLSPIFAISFLIFYSLSTAFRTDWSIFPFRPMSFKALHTFWLMRFCILTYHTVVSICKVRNFLDNSTSYYFFSKDNRDNT